MNQASPRIDHLAFPSFDPAETHRFYTEVLGLPLLSAFEAVSKEWGNKRFLMFSFGTGGAQTIDFFALEGAQRPADDGLPKDNRHFGMAFESRGELKALKQRLEAHGVSFWIEEHGPGEQSVYFGDPNGVTIEIRHAEMPAPEFEQSASEEARAAIANWSADRGR
jgi:catechol 2,3-dioxygenase-like lactoylglutathione lyase family enzyme